MRDKILPINKPYITHTPESSFLFSLLANIDTADEWICSRLLSMVVRKENVHDEFSMVGKYFEECPFLHIVNVSNEALMDIYDIEFTQSIVKAISNGWYVSAIINSKYISNYNIKHDYFHHIHFYGYNLDKNVVYAADHFRNGYYSTETCNISDLHNARTMVDSDIAYIKLLHNIKYNLSLDTILLLINEHVNGENLFVKYTNGETIYPDDSFDNYYFGIKYYDALTDVIMSGRFPYKRPIILICEHIKIIKMLILIIQRKIDFNAEKLLQITDDLIEKSNILKYYYIKVNILNGFNEIDFNIINNKQQKEKIISMINNIKEIELMIFEKISKLLLDAI